MISSLTRALFCLLLMCLSLHAQTVGLPADRKTISLINNNEESFVIGQIEFNQSGEKTSYKIEFEESVFQDEFLSMRPFKCLHHEKTMICHLVYPYQKQGYITSDDMMDLEYDLLFLHKSPEEYGINAWNGLYYKLENSEEGIQGILKEVDLNVLAAPPEEGILRPVSYDMLYDADPVVHIYPKILIH